MKQSTDYEKAPGLAEVRQKRRDAPQVLFASSEVAPLMKTGGLADVSAALPAALAQLGCTVRIVMPGYGDVLDALPSLREIDRLQVDGHAVTLAEAATDDGVPVTLVICPALFGRAGDPYLDAQGHDWADNAQRFALFARVIVHLARGGHAGFSPNLVHLNDWQTGLAAALLAQATSRPATVFGIHNLGYQGLFSYETFCELGLPSELWSFEALEYHGQLSMIKGGIAFADALTTVSPTYAREILSPQCGAGLDGLLRYRADRLTGIVNGIDTRVWNPAEDTLIAAPYDAQRLDAKAQSRRALQRELRLPDDPVPLFATVSRLVSQKGVDLLIDALPDLVRLGQVVVLGSGEPGYESALGAAMEHYPGRFVYIKARSERLAHMIEAGADIFLMPSRFEPCGLNQLYSMRYGTVPVARRTGGLADTIVPIADGRDDGTGFLFDEASAGALVSAAAAAANLFRHRDEWRRIQRNGMRQDFSWTSSAQQYLDIYQSLLNDTDATTRGANLPDADGAD